MIFWHVKLPYTLNEYQDNAISGSLASVLVSKPQQLSLQWYSIAGISRSEATTLEMLSMEKESYKL